MLIQYHGVSCAKLTTKIDNIDVSVLVDPFGPEIGKLPRNLSADIVTVSRAGDPEFGAVAEVKGEHFLIDHAGEYEVKGIPVYGIPAKNCTFYYFIIEDLRVAHLGGVGSELTDEQLDRLGDVDILMLPIGGGNVLDAKKAADLVSRIEPRAVIPLHYKLPGMKLKADDLAPFIKESGLKGETMDKWKVQKKDLSQEETQLVMLSVS